MMDANRRRKALGHPKPEPPWKGEPLLGAVYGEEEIEAAVAAMRDSEDVSRGFGFTSEPIVKFQQEFAAFAGTKHAVAVNSAGPGLDLAMRYLRLQPGDEVIVPAVNYVAASLAVLGAGGQVVWGEVDERTFELDPNDVEEKLTPRTRAIFPVHMNGLSAPMDELIEVGRRHPHDTHGTLPVIGDAARACGGGYKGTRIGQRGLMTVFSLHTMKNMTTLGEGGMITTDDDDVEEFCRLSRMFGGGKYWGTSNVMTKVQAAVGSVQLGKLKGFIDARRRLAQARDELLAGLPEITTPHEPADCEHSYYLYTCLVKPEWAGDKRDRLIQLMDAEYGVGCVVANPPCYQSNAFLAERCGTGPLPRSEALGRRIFCVSVHPAMTDADNEYAVAALIECVERLRRE
ncbi:MAG: DegT/DnrJ/EryC1/StrS family aminotransferase [Armatimonadetes bacterium]|nr:DegT/DnrJ/EryC1/StrS family aminotransferase [Armatimonadota bacterium]